MNLVSRPYGLLAQLIFFSSLGWKSWGVRAKPAIPDGMPLLIDDGLVFVAAGGAGRVCGEVLEINDLLGFVRGYR